MNQNPQTPNAGPKALTIEEYKARQKKKEPKGALHPRKQKAEKTWRLRLEIEEGAIDTPQEHQYETTTNLGNSNPAMEQGQ